MEDIGTLEDCLNSIKCIMNEFRGNLSDRLNEINNLITELDNQVSEEDEQNNIAPITRDNHYDRTEMICIII